MVLLLILIIEIAIAYDFKCPVQAEWRLRANVSCLAEDKYVCLFDLLKKKYQDECLEQSDRSSIGSNLVFQPNPNKAKCNSKRYQPIIFTTNGNSECIFSKSKCDEEGQIVYSNGSSSIDIVCRCDYTQGYAFVTKPQNSCFCKPSEEDCSCFRVKCKKLSSDYQCIGDRDLTANTTCQEIHTQTSYNKQNQTVQYIASNIYNYSHPNTATCIIITVMTVCFVSTVIVALKVNIFEHLSSNTDEINPSIIKEESGNHYSARIIFIGQNGAGKTSLMRRLLWSSKTEVFSIQSTDGIEIEKCNINVTNGKWSKCDKIDDDLVRMINQVYTKKKIKKEKTPTSNIGEKASVQGNTKYKAEETNISFNDNFEINKTISDENIFEESGGKTNHDENDKEDNKGVEIIESNLNQVEAEAPRHIHSKDNQTKSNDIEHESSSKDDDIIDEMTSTIIKSCLRQNVDDPHDILASCRLWDFAGQKDFYATHQVFLSTCAVYLLVTDSLEFSATELWTDFKNSAQYVQFWFDAIHSYCSISQKDRLDPPVIVVCTKLDAIKNLKERQQRQEEFKESLLKGLAGQKKKKHLRNIYFVSNTQDDMSVFEEIRQEISRYAMDMYEWGKNCPLKWLLFQQVLGKLKESDVPISTTTKLFKIAKHDDIAITTDEEFKLCLQYFHNNGTVIYFEEEHLKDHVILDPKWLVDAFRCLVSDKIEPAIVDSDDWLNLTETGELTETLVSGLFKKEPKLKFLENKSHLLEVMKRFDIIVSLKNSTSLYMPCMMKSCTFEEVRKHIEGSQSFNKTSWFCLEFKFLPPAFFNHILAWYIKHHDVSVIYEKRTRTERKALYRQIGIFDIDTSGCEQLVVCEGPNVIALQIWNSQISDRTYELFRTNFCQFVDTLCNRYRLKIEFTPAFKCKDGDFTINRRKMSRLSPGEYRCLEHDANHLSKDLVHPWYHNDLEQKRCLEQERKLTYL